MLLLLNIASFLYLPVTVQILGKLAVSLWEVSKTFLTVGGTAWTRGRPVARPLSTQDSTAQRGQTSMPREGFEPSIHTVSRRPRGHCHWHQTLLE
jgi:hypothetical protein